MDFQQPLWVRCRDISTWPCSNSHRCIMLRKVGLLGAVASAAAFTAPATLPLRASSNVASSARPLRAGAAAVEMVDAGAVAAAVPGLVALGVVLQNNAAAPAPAAAAPATSPTPADMPTIATARVCFCRCPSPSLPPCARCEMHFAKLLRQGDRLRLPTAVVLQRSTQSSRVSRRTSRCGTTPCRPRTPRSSPTFT